MSKWDFSKKERRALRREWMAMLSVHECAAPGGLLKPGICLGCGEPHAKHRSPYCRKATMREAAKFFERLKWTRATAQRIRRLGKEK